MTRQEAFNKVVEHFIINENPPGMSPKGNYCSYGTKDRPRCAFSILLSDEQLEQALSLEDLSIPYSPSASRLIEDFNWEEFHNSEGNPDNFFSYLQAAHDRSADSDNFTVRFSSALILLAQDYNLEVPDVLYSRS